MVNVLKFSDVLVMQLPTERPRTISRNLFVGFLFFFGEILRLKFDYKSNEWLGICEVLCVLLLGKKGRGRSALFFFAFCVNWGLSQQLQLIPKKEILTPKLLSQGLLFRLHCLGR